MMWIIHPVFIITLCMFFFNVLAGSRTDETSGDICKVLHPLLYGIICFLVFLVVILLILLFKIITSMQRGLRRDHMTSETGESTALSPNNVLSVSPLSGDGGDDSSSTSSGTPEGSLADLSSISQRYVSLQERSKTSDYINVSESVSPGQVDFNSKIMAVDYVNVKEESRRKKINRRGQASCDDGTTSVSSDASTESAVNYSMVVFTKTDKQKM
ncbi:uncharacterized protein LOC125257248 [Megalobrama amblycephala]|uniref:uncharacterized protein LOC125257248 n=1 Tax=Megalobrama amblycephala TaxID=75352 RepID=UPI002013FB2C|nr:uncharacterized protein LOC125257248 [Megalobrama amblycephala]